MSSNHSCNKCGHKHKNKCGDKHIRKCDKIKCQCSGRHRVITLSGDQSLHGKDNVFYLVIKCNIIQSKFFIKFIYIIIKKFFKCKIKFYNSCTFS